MNILNRLTVKHLKLNKKRTIVTIIGIILSGSLMVGIGALGSSIRDYLVKTMENEEGHDQATILEVPYQNIKYIASNATVKDYYLHYPLGYAILSESKNSAKPYLYLEAANESYLKTSTLVKGRLPENNQEVIISSHIESNARVNYDIGDQITLNLGKRYLDGNASPLKQNNPYDSLEQFISDRTVTYTIVGIMERRYDESYSAPGYTVLTKSSDTDLSSDSLVPVSILYKEIKNIHNKTKQLAASVEAPSYTYLNEDGKEERQANITYNEKLLSFYGESSYHSLNDVLVNVIVVLLLLVSGGCALVIYNSFAISVMERKKQFGLMSSIGTTKKQIRKTVFFEALIVGLIGIPLGVLGGIFGIWCVIQVINHLLPGIFLFPLTLSLYPSFIIIPIIYMIVTILLSALLPAHKAAKISPIESIRLNDDIKIKSKKIKINKLTEKIYGVEGVLALKNIKRNKKKYRITILSLIVSIVLFIGFSTFLEIGKESGGGLMNLEENDLVVYYNSTTDDLDYSKEVITKVASTTGVDQYLGLLPPFTKSKFRLSYKIEDMNLTSEYLAHLTSQGILTDSLTLPIIALDSVSYRNYLNKLGLSKSEYEGSTLKIIFANSYRYHNNDKKTYEDYKISNYKGLKTIPLEFETFDNIDSSSDQLGEGISSVREVNVPITFVNEAPDLYGKSLVAVISAGMIQTLRENFLPSRNEPINQYYATNILIKAEKYNEVEKTLFETFPSGTFHITNYAKNVQTERNVLLLFSILLYGFITLVTLIGVTSVFNTITTSIALRRKEFAVLRSVGLSPKGFNRMICFESLLYGVRALLWGLPLSFIVVILFNWIFGNVNTTRILFIPWKAVIICILAVFVITFLTMIYSTRKIKNENILDAIREENI